jgi:hypothetical protein
MKSRHRTASPRLGTTPDFGLQFTRSNHEIETSEMGFNGQFALHRFPAARVGFGSKADILPCLSNVRFTPKSGH